MKFHSTLALVVVILTTGVSATPEFTRRESFDRGWRFARFGTMPDGSHLAEPGAKPATITASTEESGNSAERAVDGNRDTRWCADGDGKNQWLLLDLGRKAALGGIKVLWEKETQNPFAVGISDDGRSWRDALTKRPASGVEEIVSFTTTGRYLRLNIDGSTGAWASVREVEALDPQGRRIDPVISDSTTEASPESTKFDDSDWRPLDLPHDWAIEGPFRMEIENETGKLPWVGIGWYRKNLEVPASASGRRFYLDFDGAMAQPRVFVNGHLAGEWKYGYTAFRIDLTPHLNFGGNNIIAVRLENLPTSTRWYPGAGIYRHVMLTESPRIHIANWGVYVTTPEITDPQATVEVETTIENHSGRQGSLRIVEEVLDGKTVVAKGESRIELPAEGKALATTTIRVPNPKRWDLKSPNLYTVRTTVFDGEETVDQTTTTFGIRKIEWHAQNGFLLNGHKVVLHGVCNHHDLGPLGAAVHTRGIERQIEILKEMGCNSIRTSHNPPSRELLELCDRMGILVIDEVFDIWKLQKYGKVNGYNIFWDDWHEKDVTHFMLRDRNHPSIIAWSTGNEIPELSRPDMFRVPVRLKELITRYDTTRPVTAGSNHPPAAWNGFQKTVDVFGLNYYLGSYGQVADALPDMPLYASETASTVSTRGEYFFPVDWNISKGYYNFQVSSYDLYAPGWAYRPDLQFEALDKHPRFAGEFVWTGFDYLGEPTPYNQDQTNALNFADPKERAKAMEELKRLGNRAPSRSSYFGILDLCGFRKDRFYLYQARWRPELPMAHILPHWNWQERVGEVTPVHVYTNGDEAELFLNGKSLGKRRIGKPHAYRLVWDEVKYQPGKLEVVVTKGGKPWAKAVKETTGPPARLELTADRAEISSDGRDLSYLTVRILDARGIEVPRTRTPVHIRVSGPLQIAGIGNGDPTDHTPMKPMDPARARINAFNGLAQVIVRSKPGETGDGLVEIAAEGLGVSKVDVATLP